MTDLHISHLTVRCDTGQTLHEDKEIEVEIIPYASGKNIATINGEYHGRRCSLERSDLHGLPLKLKGTGGSLTERISFSLSGHSNKKGEFETFLTCMCTTLVQFRLWGQVFPDIDAPVAEVSSDVLCDEVFRQLRRPEYIESKNAELSDWVRGMNSFWHRWRSWFTRDISKQQLHRKTKNLKQRVSQLEQMQRDTMILVEQQRKQIEMLYAQQTELCRDIQGQRALISSLQNTLNKMVALERRMTEMENALRLPRRLI